MQQAMLSAYEQWSGTVPELRKEEILLRAENTTTIKLVEALDGLTAGYNPLRWLFNKVARWQQLPKLEGKLAANNKRLADIVANVESTADQCASIICKAYAGDKKDITARRDELLDTVDQMREERGLFTEALERTADVLGDLDRAWQEADEAEDMEHMDAWSGDNAGINFWSHFETDEAVTALREVKVVLENYKEYLDFRFSRNASVRVSDATISALADGNDFDFIIDMFGGFMGAWTSWENAEKLSEAKAQLSTLRGQIDGIHGNFAIAYDAAARKEDEALAALSSFRKDILRKLAVQGGADAKQFLGELMDNMSADEVALRTERRAQLQARFG